MVSFQVRQVDGSLCMCYSDETIIFNGTNKKYFFSVFALFQGCFCFEGGD